MGYPFTRQGYNIYDLMSMLQKGIRRGRYEEAGFAAKHLKDEYRQMMWNRMFVISSEDCFGVITKELVALHEKDLKERDDEAVSQAIALMCKSLKSRDACYFSCNFVLTTRKPRDIEVTDEECKRVKSATGGSTEYDSNGFMQMTLDFTEDDEFEEEILDGAILQKALNHRDMDMAGYYADKYRKKDREFLWKVLIDNMTGMSQKEVIALHDADGIVNKNKKDKDEIFLAKACMIEMYSIDDRFDDIRSSELISDKLIDWSNIKVKSINDCFVPRIPEWVYDCHTLKGKKMGKTDWDMTITEQAALNPLMDDYFSNASWIYTYEDDFKNGIENNRTMAPIRKYAETHPANPIEPFDYI